MRINKKILILFLMILGVLLLFACSGKTVEDEIIAGERDKIVQLPITDWYPTQETATGNLFIVVLNTDDPNLIFFETSLDGETYEAGKIIYSFSELKVGSVQKVYTRLRGHYSTTGTRYLTSEPSVMELTIRDLNENESFVNSQNASVIYYDYDKESWEDWFLIDGADSSKTLITVTSSLDLSLFEYNFVPFSKSGEVGDIFSLKYKDNWTEIDKQSFTIQKYKLIADREYEGYIRYKGDDTHLPSSNFSFRFVTETAPAAG